MGSFAQIETPTISNRINIVCIIYICSRCSPCSFKTYRYAFSTSCTGITLLRDHGPIGICPSGIRCMGSFTSISGSIVSNNVNVTSIVYIRSRCSPCPFKTHRYTSCTLVSGTTLVSLRSKWCPIGICPSGIRCMGCFTSISTTAICHNVNVTSIVYIRSRCSPCSFKTYRYTFIPLVTLISFGCNKSPVYTSPRRCRCMGSLTSIEAAIINHEINIVCIVYISSKCSPCTLKTHRYTSRTLVSGITLLGKQCPFG